MQKKQTGWSTLRKLALTISLGLVAALATQVATAEVYTDPVGFYKVAIVPGAQMVSAPMHRIQTFRGLVASTTSSTVTISNSPGFTVNQFGPLPLGDGSEVSFHQYMLIVKKDASATPGVEGDWWPIDANTAGTVTLGVGVDDLTTILGAGDQIEIRHLTTLGELFGTNSATCILNKDSNGIPRTSEEDLIKKVNNTSFDLPYFFHDSAGVIAPTGYYYGDTDDPHGPDVDGSVITFTPSQGFMVFRKAATGSTNMVSIGQVQVTKLTHYFVPGGNAGGNAFPANADITTSQLQEASWISDVNGIPRNSEEDLVKQVIGTSFDQPLFYHNSAGVIAPTGWYYGDTDTPVDSTNLLVPGKGYMFFLKTGSGAMKWRQAVPFTP